MRIEIKGKAIFEFSSDNYILCKSNDEMLGDYSLNYLIDRSEVGKHPDVGMPVIYLSETEAESLFKAGFSKTN